MHYGLLWIIYAENSLEKLSFELQLNSKSYYTFQGLSKESLHDFNNQQLSTNIVKLKTGNKFKDWICFIKKSILSLGRLLFP